MLVITVSVDYVDILEYVYTFNQSEISQLDWYIITSPDDIDTRLFCEKNRIQYYITNLFYINGAKFNKAGAINDFILSRNTIPDWILLLDSDIILSESIREFNKISNKQNNCLYGCKRNLYTSMKDHQSLKHTKDNYPFLGYFQLFHKDNIKSYLDKGQGFLTETRNSAFYDKEFAQRFDKKHLLSTTVDHLGEVAVNWDGRKSKPWK